MNMDNERLSSQELAQRFDLLAIDAREYALIILGIDGKILCWNIGA